MAYIMYDYQSMVLSKYLADILIIWFDCWIDWIELNELNWLIIDMIT